VYESSKATPWPSSPAAAAVGILVGLRLGRAAVLGTDGCELSRDILERGTADQRITGAARMVSLTEKTTIRLPAAEVWPLLSDPALVASCIPGAALAPDQGDGLWRGSIRVKFGPTVAVFRGEAGLTFDAAARTCSIEGRGIDGRGASRALASGTVRVTSSNAGGSDVTELAVDGSFTVSGPLETFANAGGVHVARALLAEFSANLAKLVAEQRTTAPPPAANALPSAPADAMLAPASPGGITGGITGAPPAPAPPAAAELSAPGSACAAPR
jgi:carbon monoxide dehydrogenase subunit G